MKYLVLITLPSGHLDFELYLEISISNVVLKILHLCYLCQAEADLGLLQHPRWSAL